MSHPEKHQDASVSPDLSLTVLGMLPEDASSSSVGDGSDAGISDAGDGRNPVDVLADEYSSRLRAGETPTIEEYEMRAPDHRSAIRALFPTIAMIETMTKQAHSPEKAKRRLLFAQETIGDFHIIREVGRGGMGIVYEAEQRSLQRRVALKVLGTGISNSPHQLDRFRREAESAARLHHTNIVQVYGIGDEAGIYFYAMQFIDGISLSAAIESYTRRTAVDPTSKSVWEPSTNELAVAQGNTDTNPGRSSSSEFAGNRPNETKNVAAGIQNKKSRDAAPDSIGPDLFADVNSAEFFRRIARLAAQVADALNYAHEHGVLHRDIKPSNLMLDHAGDVWIMDFGLVKIIESQDLTRTGEIVGTLRYMAPEQLNGQADRTTDIYSLGLTLYELLTQKPAFEGASTTMLSQRMHGGEIPRPRSVNRAIPLDLETIVLKATAREPSGRYATAANLAEDLRRFCEDRPILARRSTLAERLWRWSRRNPALAFATSSAILLLGLVAAVATSGRLQVEAALREAKSAQRQAESNLDSAINAFDSILDNVTSRGIPRSLAIDISESEAGLTQTPLSPADALLLDRLLEFYREFANQSEDNSSRRLRIADAHHRAGTILVRLGRLAEAEQDFRRAIDLLANTPKTDPHYASVIVQSASLFNEIGELHLRRGEFRKTSDSHLEARALLLEQPDKIKADPSVRFELARSTDLLASIDVRSGSNEGPGAIQPGPAGHGPPPPGREHPSPFGDGPPPEFHRGGERPPRKGPPGGPFDERKDKRLINAEPDALRNRGVTRGDPLSTVLFETSNEFRSLCREFPEKTDYQFALAQCLRHRLVHAATSGDAAVARETFLEAVEILDRLASRFPTEPKYQFELADTLTQAYRAQTDVESRLSLDRAIATAKELAERFPSVSEYQLLLGTALARSAAIHANSGSERDAEKYLGQSIEILEGLATKFSDQAIIQIPLAKTREQLGNLIRTSSEGNSDPSLRLKQSQAELETAIERFETYLSKTQKQGNFNTATRSSLYSSLAETLTRLDLPVRAEEARRKAARERRPGPPPPPK